MKKNVLILGSEGQIGSALKDYLSKSLKFQVMISQITHQRIYEKNKKLNKLIKASDFIFF